MAWQPRMHWDWLVAESRLSPAEDQFRTTHRCSICDTWLVQRVDDVPESIRINTIENDHAMQDPMPSMSETLRWSTSGGELDIRCRCGWPHRLTATGYW